MNRFLVLCFVAAALSRGGEAQQISSITLSVTPATNPTMVSDPVTLTAVVSPPQATGKVTFYDGTTILGLSGLTAGKATLVTRLLPPETRSLQARYGGDTTYQGSTSTVIRQTVNAKQGFGFTPAIGSPFAVTNAPFFLAVGDFNGDGKPDLVAPSQTGAGVTVLLNDGNGGLTPAAAGLFAKGISALAIAVADFNGDGKLDLAIPDSRNNNITLWLGDGAGGFLGPMGPFATGTMPWGLAVADFNADGKPDLAVANDASNSVTVLLGDGNGGFLAASAFPTGMQPIGVSAGDFNGDGKPDLAIANSGDNTITILLGDGNGGFNPAPGQPPSTSSFPTFLAVEDFDGDGNQDVAVANSGTNSVTVLLGDGSGGFTPAQGSPFRTGISPFAVAVGDFNGDGKPDLASANSLSNDVTVLLGSWSSDSPPKFLGFTPSEQSPIPAGASPSASTLVVVAADFNGDGKQDLAAVNQGDNTVALLLANLGLRITQGQSGSFLVNQSGAYALAVTNDRATAVSGQVAVVDTLPPGLTPTAANGTGWTCSIAGQNVTCTRSDSLGAGQDYPTISLTVAVTAPACPSAPNVIKVSLNNEISAASSAPSPVLNCLTVNQSHSGRFVVNSSGTGTYTLTVERANGVVIQSGMNVAVADTLPNGLTPVTASGPGWSCPIAGQNVTCTWSGDLAGTTAFPSITLGVNVAPSACPSAINVAEVLVNASFQAFSNPDSADAAGCLVVQPTNIDFQNFPIHVGGRNGSAKLAALTVTSSDKNALSFTAATTAEGFLLPSKNTCALNVGEGCTIAVAFFPVCLGQQVGQVTIVTDAGATYQVPLSGFGVPNQVSFPSGSLPTLPSTLIPGGQYPVGLTLTPSPDQSCGQSPSVALSFTPPATDGTNYDVKLDPNASILQAGTVAGTITLQAQINGKNITAQDGSGAVMLQVPSQTGVVQSVSIGQKTQSSFQVGVIGFSTPRETGPNATTQVCLSFLPATGATVDASAQFCTLKEDLEIWYERTTSYPTGSQFQAGITVSFSGDMNAIGGIKVLIKNKVGDSQPYCVDFKSGTKLDPCP